MAIQAIPGAVAAVTPIAASGRATALYPFLEKLRGGDNQRAEAIAGREALDRAVLSQLFEQGAQQLQSANILDELMMQTIAQQSAASSVSGASTSRTSAKASSEKGSISAGSKPAPTSKKDEPLTAATGESIIMDTLKEAMRDAMEQAVDFKGLIASILGAEGVLNDESTVPTGEGVVGTHPFAGWMQERRAERKDQELLNRQGAR